MFFPITVYALLKKPTWDPHETYVGTMWVLVGNMWESCGTHMRNCCGIPLGTMWVPCGCHMTKLKKLVKNKFKSYYMCFPHGSTNFFLLNFLIIYVVSNLKKVARMKKF